MKKAAILIDGEWFRISLDNALKPNLPKGVTADVMYRNALLSLAADEEVFRIFYYDCPPFGGKERNPIDQSQIDFKTEPKFQARNLFLSEFKQKDFVAMRMGVTRTRGWTLAPGFIQKAIQGSSAAPLPTDVYLSKEQKGVDMRIGIDVATLALKKIVERVILISGDTDMIPAMKLARREGVQVVLVHVGGCGGLSKQLDEDADLVRTITPVV